MAQLSFKQQRELNGNEDDVRDRMARGLYHGEHLGVAQEWLRKLDAGRAAASSAKRDAREESTLAIAAEALSIAKDANRIASEELAVAREAASSARRNARWAMYAAITAVVAAIIAAKDQIYELIVGLP